MFESTRIPPAWVDPLNKMDAVVVPSEFCRDVFIDCGVTSPVHVVPLGISEVYRPAESRPDRPITFLAFLDRGARKGGIVAIQTFVRAFGESMDYRLILKGRAPRVPIQFLNPNIEVVQADMTEEELCKLYQRADVLINPHKGEGFGMIPREAAACGCIVLTTGWSGTVDNLPEWGWPLPYTMERADWSGARNLEGLPLGDWAAQDIPGITAILGDVVNNFDAYRDLSVARATNVRKLYSWQSTAESVLKIWRDAAHANAAAVGKSALHASSN
jgi:glycosyltransferase involved in cell wall biosynthesis